MKVKILIVVLLLACLGLGSALFVVLNRTRAEKTDLVKQVTYHSDAEKQASVRLEEQRQVNMALERDLKTRASEMTVLSNNLNKVIADLEKSDAQAKATAEQLRTAQAELAKKDLRINAMEGERTELGKQMDTLTNSISDLGKQIRATESKLARAEGDKDLLWKELKRLQSEKAELERQFNDLAVMRAQVSKLKEELAISRRLEFLRLSLFGGSAKGGAEKLMAHVDKNPATPPPAPGYNLNVEVHKSEASRTAPATNAPTASSNTNSNAAPTVPPTNAAALKPVSTNAAVTLPKDAPASAAK